MILIDPPAWPAHGTLFGHLVSDTSLVELHLFARAHGIPARGFDHDHYDVPIARYDELVAAGATPVGSGELVRRLVRSGLRVRPTNRTPTRTLAHEQVSRAWEEIIGGPDAVRDDLLARWGEPHRHYHDVRHLAACVSSLVDLGSRDPAVHLAAWFHDAVYAGIPGEDEEASARLAEELLDGGWPSATVAEVARLVRLTTHHDPDPDDGRGALLVDADLSILGASPGRYHVYVRDVRLDYAHVDDAAFNAGRRHVVRSLLAREPLFHTPSGARTWGRPAHRNLHEELALLASQRAAGHVTGGLLDDDEVRPLDGR